MNLPLNELLAVAPLKAQKAFAGVLAVLIEELGCSVSVRGQSASFTIGSDLLAAAHPREDAIDLALSLPLDTTNSHLFDAIDFKWRGLPAAVTVIDAKSARVAADHVRKASQRLKNEGALSINGESFARPSGAYQPQFKDAFRRRR